MKIAYFTDHFLPKTDGLVTRLCSTLPHIKSSGHEVQVYTVGNSPVDYPYAEVHRCAELFLLSSTHRKVPQPCFKNIFQNLSAWHPDVLHVINATPMAWAAYRYNAIYQCPLVLSLHTDYLNYLSHYKVRFLSSGLKMMIQLYSRRPQLITVPSDITRHQLNALGIYNIDLWHTGIDVNKFNPEKFSRQMRYRLSQGNPDLPLLLYVGRLGPEKNMAILFEVLKALPGIRLAIVGDGPIKSALERQFSGSATYFSGALHDEELASAYASADILLMPSTSETLGMVVLEAMASGCAVIAANAGGLPEMVSHEKTGFLFDPARLDTLVGAIKTYLEQPQIRYKHRDAARQQVMACGWEQSTQKLLQSYQRVLTNQGTR